MNIDNIDNVLRYVTKNHKKLIQVSKYFRAFFDDALVKKAYQIISDSSISRKIPLDMLIDMFFKSNCRSNNRGILHYLRHNYDDQFHIYISQIAKTLYERQIFPYVFWYFDEMYKRGFRDILRMLILEKKLNRSFLNSLFHTRDNELIILFIDVYSIEFHQFLFNSSDNVIKHAIDNDANIDPDNALFLAIKRNNVTITKYLVEKFLVKPNFVTIEEAIKVGNLEIVTFLYNLHPFELTFFIFEIALINKRLSVARFFLEKGFKITEETNNLLWDFFNENSLGRVIMKKQYSSTKNGSETRVFIQYGKDNKEICNFLFDECKIKA